MTPFEHKFQTVINNAKQIVATASDSELKNNDFINLVLNKIKISPPFLQKNGYSTEVKTELFTIRNAPSGYQVKVGGQPFDCVYCKMPVNGDLNIFNLIFDRRLGYFTNLVGNTLVHKIVSKDPVIGNHESIETINREAVNFFNSIETQLNRAKQEIEEFHSSKLTNSINIFISDELKRRDTEAKFKQSYIETISKLNPFNKN